MSERVEEGLSIRRARGALGREVNTVLVAVSLGFMTCILIRLFNRGVEVGQWFGFMETYVGIAWPFFVLVALFLFYALGAWTVEVFALGTARRWNAIAQGLHWATEACPLVGLITTFISLLTALLVYGEAGPGKPETQAAFISQFAIAFGSSITGGILALLSFTLHWMIPKGAEDEE